jgi:hypothetical protein
MWWRADRQRDMAVVLPDEDAVQRVAARLGWRGRLMQQLRKSRFCDWVLSGP